MIVELLLSAIFNVFKLLTLPINIPSLPDSVQGFLTTAFSYLHAGVGILANYCDLGYLFILLGIVVAIDVGVSLYHFVMWIIKKIPMLSIS